MQARCSRKSAISIIAENVAPLDKSYSCVTHDAHRKLAFSTLAHDTLGVIPLVAGVVTTFHTSAKNSVQKLIDYTTYVKIWLLAILGKINCAVMLKDIAQFSGVIHCRMLLALFCVLDCCVSYMFLQGSPCLEPHLSLRYSVWVFCYSLVQFLYHIVISFRYFERCKTQLFVWNFIRRAK